MPRVARKTRNQALFREVNERIADVAAGFDAPAQTQEFICECSAAGVYGKGPASPKSVCCYP